MLRLYAVVAIIAAGLNLTPASAQSTIPNPLRAKPAETAAGSPKAATTDVVENKSDAKPAKPKRERSAKQKQSDEDMRACGASWRAEKAALSAKGTKWRAYLKECRAAKKAGRERA